ncbi:TIGR02530 family flagellar biosynthesis protein [Clostridium oryzae]|uniref:Flagellar operon protein n=1 Tax=Clostridium oryzae TaxID=1450648 RepID=A0A1V4ITD2_9CLOT|nr:TIGR02530 family flagellar biosynthesis protein [Clostridium oryzae]OPJ63272.1 hypothetical protein CLORY_13550 [Clostridium oryzae]
MGYRVINGNIYPVGNFPVVEQNNSVSKHSSDNKVDFNDVLKDKLESKGFVISKHAAERLKGSELTDTDMKNINSGINKAQEKGARNCLILYKDVALVTSIENRTVITAVQRERMKENVFTNLDSVVML